MLTIKNIGRWSLALGGDCATVLDQNGPKCVQLYRRQKKTSKREDTNGSNTNTDSLHLANDVHTHRDATVGVNKGILSHTVPQMKVLMRKY